MKLDISRLKPIEYYDTLPQYSLSRFNFAAKTVLTSSIIYFIFRNWTEAYPDYWWAWKIPNQIAAGLRAVWPLFAWAALPASAVAIYLLIKRRSRTASPREVFGLGLFRSLHAGVYEEIVFRWALVLSAPFGLKLANVITFGFVEWIYTHWLIPLANAATFGILEPQLLTANWLSGAAIIVASVVFRDAHKYLGLFGYINSWFLGMIFFFVVFNYGLITAMLAHFLYNAIIFTISAISQKTRKPSPYLSLAEAIVNATLRDRRT